MITVIQIKYQQWLYRKGQEKSGGYIVLRYFFMRGWHCCLILGKNERHRVLYKMVFIKRNIVSLAIYKHVVKKRFERIIFQCVYYLILLSKKLIGFGFIQVFESTSSSCQFKKNKNFDHKLKCGHTCCTKYKHLSK